MNDELDQEVVAEIEAVFAEDDEWGIDVESEVALTLSIPEDWPLAEVMRLRGAVSSAGPMLSNGILDLTTKASGDVRLDLAFMMFSMAGQQALDAAKVALDRWLEDNGAPLVSLYPVQSSNLAAMGWHLGVAVVEFQNGGVYAYQEVPEALFHEWFISESVGKFLQTEIKPNHAVEKLA